MRRTPVDAPTEAHPLDSALLDMWGGSAWPTAQGACSCTDPATGEPAVDGVCMETGWCVGTEVARWSDGERTITTRSPIGLQFDASAGVANLGGGAYAIGCHPSLIRWSDPPLVCLLELHEEVGMLRVDRVVPVPPPDQAILPGLADWAVQRSGTSLLLGERKGDDLVVAFPDSIALISLTEWTPEPPAVCIWGIDYCSDGVVIGNRLFDRGDSKLAVEVECRRIVPGTKVELPPQTYCATCILSSVVGRGETRPAEDFRQGWCEEKR